MKKLLLSAVLVGSLSCSAVFAQPSTGGGFSSLFTHKAAESSKNSQSQCPLKVIGNTLKTLMALNLKPIVSLETSNSALDELNNLNSKYCSKSQITVANNSEGLTMVSGSGFTTYGCYLKDSSVVICYVFTSNYDVA